MKLINSNSAVAYSVFFIDSAKLQGKFLVAVGGRTADGASGSQISSMRVLLRVS